MSTKLIKSLEYERDIMNDKYNQCRKDIEIAEYLAEKYLTHANECQLQIDTLKQTYYKKLLNLK